MTNTEKLICEAINTRRVLYFLYENETTPRTIEPYTLGHREGIDELELSAWQTDGPSEGKTAKGWRTFMVAKMKFNRQVQAAGFTKPRKGYTPGDSRMAEIICEFQPVVK